MGHARRWLGRSTPWLFVLASAATAFPIVVARMLGRHLPTLLDGPIKWCWIWLAGVSLITVVPFAALGSVLSPTIRGSWIRAFVPFAPVAAGMTICFAGEAVWLEPLSLAHAVGEDWTKGLLVVPPFVFAALAFGRRGASDSDSLVQIRYASIALWLAGAFWTRMNPPFSFACFGPVDFAEYAGCGAFGTTFRIACGVTAVSWIGMSLVMQRLTRDRSGRIDAVGLGIWIATSVTLDGVAWVVGRAVCGASDGREEVRLVDGLATVADAVQWSGAAAAALCWGLSGLAALGSASPDSRRESWRALWPVLPILWIASSPAFDAALRMHSAQQFPDAAWEQHASFEPLTRPGVGGQYVDYRGDSQWTDVIGTLSADGELWLYHGSHAYVSRGDADIARTPDLKHGRRVVELMVDRRVTLGQLIRAAQRLRRSDGISIVWRMNDLHRASGRARDRWAFVEMGSRAVAGYELALHLDPTGCVSHRHDGLRFARCDQGSVLEGPETLSVESLLPMLERSEGAWGIAVPAELVDFEVERPIRGMQRRPDPIGLRVLPHAPVEAFALALGLLALLFAAVVSREYLFARRLTRLGARVDDLSATTTSPAWSRWRASLGSDPDSHPYRRRGTERAFTPLGLLRRDLAELAKGAARASAFGAVTWLVVACLGFVIGALALWLGR